MPAIRSGHVTAFFMYDVADAIGLQAVPSLTTHTVAARLAPRPPMPAYVQYKQPPLSIDGEAIGIAEIAVVPTWNAALVYDNEAGAQAAIETLELTIVAILMFELVLFFMGIMR